MVLITTSCAVLYLVDQSCLTLCDPMDYGLPGSSVHGDSPGKNTRVDCHALLQGIFLTQGLNLGLLHCKQILYHLSHQGSPKQAVVRHKTKDMVWKDKIKQQQKWLEKRSPVENAAIIQERKWEWREHFRRF